MSPAHSVFRVSVRLQNAGPPLLVRVHDGKHPLILPTPICEVGEGHRLAVLCYRPSAELCDGAEHDRVEAQLLGSLDPRGDDVADGPDFCTRDLQEVLDMRRSYAADTEISNAHHIQGWGGLSRHRASDPRLSANRLRDQRPGDRETKASSALIQKVPKALSRWRMNTRIEMCGNCQMSQSALSPAARRRKEASPFSSLQIPLEPTSILILE